MEIRISPEVIERLLVTKGRGLTLELVVAENDLAVVQEPEPAWGPPRGPLADLLVKGELRAGERLIWERPRRGERYFAMILPNGQLEVDGVRFNSPSGAASAVSGNSVDGWLAWRRERDGQVLGSLRDRPQL